MRALIYRVDNGVFYSYIYLKADDAIIRMDARTSDAVAMALRMKAPIFIYEEILESEQLKNRKESEAGSIAPMGENPSPHEDEFSMETQWKCCKKLAGSYKTMRITNAPPTSG